jgi:ketosteroid isomerase-like protein
VSRKGALRVKLKLGSVFLCTIALVTAYACRPNDANARDATLSPQNPMAIEQTRMKSEAAIRELIGGFVKAIRAKDIDGVMSVFATEVISFDLGPPLQHGGGETFKKRWQELFEPFQGPVDYEVRDLSITAGDDVAFSHSLNRMSGTMKNGRKN